MPEDRASPNPRSDGRSSRWWRRIALGLDGQLLDRLARGDREENLRARWIWYQGKRAASRDLLKDRDIVANGLQRTRSSTMHGVTPIADLANKVQATNRPEVLALLCARAASVV